MTTLFTRIINGELQCHKLYENEYVLAILDINPLSRGHTLLISKEPAPSIDQLSQESASAMGKALPTVCRAIIAATGAASYNLIQNNGEDAGMTIPHVHIHIIPKYPESEHSFVWVPGKIEEKDALELSKLISASIK
jgi:histidine triad (HIT) family protein